MNKNGANSGLMGTGAEVIGVSNINEIKVWVWMLWQSDACEHERHHGVGMRPLVISCSRT